MCKCVGCCVLVVIVVDIDIINIVDESIALESFKNCVCMFVKRSPAQITESLWRKNGFLTSN